MCTQHHHFGCCQSHFGCSHSGGLYWVARECTWEPSLPSLASPSTDYGAFLGSNCWLPAVFLFSCEESAVFMSCTGERRMGRAGHRTVSSAQPLLVTNALLLVTSASLLVTSASLPRHLLLEAMHLLLVVRHLLLLARHLLLEAAGHLRPPRIDSARMSGFCYTAGAL